MIQDIEDKYDPAALETGRTLQPAGFEGRLAQRDALDAVQTVPAPDAVMLDTTDMSQAEQVRQIIDLARAAGASE